MQNCNALCLVSESNKQNPRDRTLDLPFFFRYKCIPSLKNLPSPAPNDSSPYWLQGNFAAPFVFNFCLREFLLSALVNRFELRCEPKRLMLLYYKICPCSLNYVHTMPANFDNGENVTCRPLVHTKMAHLLPADFENGRF